MKTSSRPVVDDELPGQQAASRVLPSLEASPQDARGAKRERRFGREGSGLLPVIAAAQPPGSAARSETQHLGAQLGYAGDVGRLARLLVDGAHLLRHLVGELLEMPVDVERRLVHPFGGRVDLFLHLGGQRVDAPVRPPEVDEGEYLGDAERHHREYQC